jgi:hypothetical protein
MAGCLSPLLSGAQSWPSHEGHKPSGSAFSALETIERDDDASQILYNKNGFVRLEKFGICQQTLKQDATNAMRKFFP